LLSIGFILPCTIVSGQDDCVVDEEAVLELAAYYRVKPAVVPWLAHDCMLDTRWEQVAQRLETWLEGL
jgi:alpha-beta hydrolase superfamily lysophospholipase